MTNDKDNENFAVYETEDAKNNKFIGCTIIGKAKFKGKGTKLINTRIINPDEESPKL